ncbi:hypothetical protein C7437_1011015 [Psychrobacillus insolitus]|uniref:Uncharacterized protein n=1 Tax=Psychrobacillus insolitus TaxID=1461 RepID=A0A2W7N780_9BACI|nr:hypothetical protein [Psychrobacillus insolitus]PZX07893.1 hypothetical protein C7437_1011015 [Psychrobacillus insolitus]
MKKDTDDNKIIAFRIPLTEEEEEQTLDLANKIQVITDLANEGIISQRSRVRIIKKLIY